MKLRKKSKNQTDKTRTFQMSYKKTGAKDTPSNWQHSPNITIEGNGEVTPTYKATDLDPNQAYDIKFSVFQTDPYEPLAAIDGVKSRPSARMFYLQLDNTFYFCKPKFENNDKKQS